MSLESVTAEWMQQLDKVAPLYVAAMRVRMGLSAFDWEMTSALFDAGRGGLMLTDAAAGAAALEIGLPVITMVGVWVALGAGYYQAREESKSENLQAGFSQGFVAAILGWKWSHLKNRFRRNYLVINQMDEAMDSIRVNSYHKGLVSGFLAGSALPDEAKKGYVRKIRRAGNVHGPKAWDQDEDVARNQQISYVIDMATTALRFQIIKAS